MLGWLAGGWLPAVAVVDAATGRLLRLTRYLGGRPAKRQELRSVSDDGAGGGSDDFGFTPPDGLRVVDRTAEGSGHGSDDDGDDDDGREQKWFGPDGQEWSPPDSVTDAVDALKRQLGTGRGFLGSFLGGR